MKTSGASVAANARAARRFIENIFEVILGRAVHEQIVGHTELITERVEPGDVFARDDALRPASSLRALPD